MFLSIFRSEMKQGECLSFNNQQMIHALRYQLTHHFLPTAFVNIPPAIGKTAEFKLFSSLPLTTMPLFSTLHDFRFTGR